MCTQGLHAGCSPRLGSSGPGRAGGDRTSSAGDEAPKAASLVGSRRLGPEESPRLMTAEARGGLRPRPGRARLLRPEPASASPGATGKRRARQRSPDAGGACMTPQAGLAANQAGGLAALGLGNGSRGAEPTPVLPRASPNRPPEAPSGQAKARLSGGRLPKRRGAQRGWGLVSTKAARASAKPGPVLLSGTRESRAQCQPCGRAGCRSMLTQRWTST